MIAKRMGLLLAGVSTLVGAFALAAITASTARAQDNATGGTVAVSTTNGAQTTTAVAATRPEDNTPDHDRFIGHFAIGYMGLAALPIATSSGGTGGPGIGTVNAPVIGVRYWLQRSIGIDAGLGFTNTTGSVEVVQGGITTSTDKPSVTGFALHGGVPLALASGKHLTWELVPEFNLGFTGSTIKNPAPGGTDTSLSGFLFNIGARAGAEIHFGFIGVPELSLEGSVGLYLRRQAVKVKQDPNSASDGSWNLSTGVGSDPWALFVNQISAFYYF